MKKLVKESRIDGNCKKFFNEVIYRRNSKQISEMKVDEIMNELGRNWEGTKVGKWEEKLRRGTCGSKCDIGKRRNCKDSRKGMKRSFDKISGRYWEEICERNWEWNKYAILARTFFFNL